MEFQLTDVEVRVLGCLIEKEMTTPLSYPLTLNALVTAANQKSNRYPVVDYDESTVLDAVDSLREKRLVETVFPGSSRVAKYKHDFAYHFGLNSKLQALMGVLMLRGPQTAGELRTRTERMARFADIKAVTDTLEELRTREEGPLLTLLPPGPGQKERRYGHLLAGEPVAPPAAEGAGHASEKIAAGRLESLEEEIAALRAGLEGLRDDFETYKASFETGAEEAPEEA